jgi:hypothetical protein
VAAFQANQGNIVVNAHQTMHELDALTREVLKLADVQRRRSDIVEVLVGWFESGRVELEEDGQPVRSLQTAHAMLSERVVQALASLTRSALLVQ